MKRIVKLAMMLVIAIAVGVGTVLAAGWFEATSAPTTSTGATQLGVNLMDWTSSTDEVQFGAGEDWIRMNAGTDHIYMAADNDEINMGPGNDVIDFYGEAGSTETIAFNATGTSRIQYTTTGDNIVIRSNAGDVIIDLGN